MIFGSVCSGIEAASVAWHPLGWKSSFYSEIERFPRALLKHRYPETQLHGDFTTIEKDAYEPIDLLAGGTPCQSFSIAGLRKGIADERGNLSLEFIRLASRLGPRWLVWENVPGVLSSNRGRDFASFLGGLAECGYGFAYRVLDAQHFGVPQRRRRVILVGYFGDWRPAAAVLFERESLLRNITPRREAGKKPAPPLTASAGRRGGIQDESGDGGLIAKTVLAKTQRFDPETENLIVHTLRGEGFDASEDGTGRGIPLVPVCVFDPNQITSPANGSTITPELCHTLASNPVAPIAFSSKDYGADASDISPTLRAMGHAGSHANAGGQVAIAIQAGAVRENPNSGPDGMGVRADGLAYTLEARAEVQAVASFNSHPTVRRLTPRECERLQGFPDDYTLIPDRSRMAADGPRYKALGNSWAVPKFQWLGRRIDMVDRLINE